MKSKSLLKLPGAIGLAALIAIPFAAGCAAPAPAPTPAPEKPSYHWRITTSSEKWVEGTELFIDEVSRLSDGRITYDLYPSQILGSNAWKSEQIALGTLEAGFENPYTTMDPRLDISNIPYVVFDWDAAIELYGAGGPIFDLIRSIGEDVGWKILDVYVQGWDLYIVTKERFIPVPEDLKPRGLVCRSMFMESDRLVTDAVGFKAIPMAFAEVDVALTTGTIDARGGALVQDLTKYADMCKYGYLYNTRPEIGFCMMNLDLYNSLSAEDQQILQQAASTATAFITNDVREKEDFFIQRGRDAGIEVIELTPEQMAANAKVTREEVWPALEKGIGKFLMDQVLAYAQPIPGG